MERIQNKKGVSVLIGYVLLVVFIIIISSLVFRWLSTYVPAEALDCPDGVSIFVSEAAFEPGVPTSQLNLTIRNNGRFNVEGFFVHATNKSGQELATIDLSRYLNECAGCNGSNGTNYVFFVRDNELPFEPGNESTYIFDIPLEIGTLYSIQATPTRFQVEEGRNRFVSCASAKTEQVIGEPVTLPEGAPACGNNVIEGTETCDDGNIVSGDGCFGTDAPSPCTVESPSSCDNDNIIDPGEFCDGTTLPPGQSCQTQGFDTGTLSCNNCALSTSSCVELCGNNAVDSADEVCDGGLNCQLDCTCPAGYVADGTNGCTKIGNGACDVGETCAQEPVACNGQQAKCNVGNHCSSEICISDGGAPSCINYCLSLNQGYTTSNCPANSGQCTGPNNGDTHGISPGQGGYNECTLSGATGNYVCCCKPKVHS